MAEGPITLTVEIEKHPGGRPLKFQSTEELSAKIDAYFAECNREEDTRIFRHDEAIDQEYHEFKDDTVRVTKCRIVCGRCHQHPVLQQGCILVSGERKEKQPYTVTGLALALDTTRQTLLDYEDRADFSDTIKTAKQRIENYAAERLFDKETPTRGVIFSLSNNSDRWTEKREETIKVPNGAAALAASLLGNSDVGN